MIANANELEVAFRNLHIFEETLEGIRRESQASNPALFPTIAQGYLRQIQGLQSDIFAYLRERPADAPLKVRLAGPTVPEGTIRVGVVSRLLQALQSALLHVGKTVSAEVNDNHQPTETTALRALLGLNLVATQTGSFILALDLAPRTLSMFEQYDVAEQSVVRLLDYVSDLTYAQDRLRAERPTLRALEKLAAVLKPNAITDIEFSYRGVSQTRDASLNVPLKERLGEMLGRVREGEETVRGLLVSIDIERDKCRIRPQGEETVDCGYSEEIEDDLILAVKKQVEVSGVIEPQAANSQRRRIRHIERFTLIGETEDE